MKPLTSREEKIAALIYAQRGVCPVCGCRLQDQTKLDPHHLLHDTEGNRQKYPIFLQTPSDLALVHSGCHDKANLFFRSDREADYYETIFSHFMSLLDLGLDETDLRRLTVSLQILRNEYLEKEKL